MPTCACGSGRELDQCCGPFLAGTAAPTAEALMRSRYTAFTTRDTDYLRTTLAPEALVDYDDAETMQWAGEAEWQGLKILATEGGGAGDETGTVEFVARYRLQGKDHVHHELSRFRHEDGRWLYVDGVIGPKPQTRHVVKVGRNDPCPCGSGRKYKKCCGA